MKYSLLFVFAFSCLIYSCQENKSETTSNSQEDKVNAELVQCDSLLAKTKRLASYLNTQFFLIKLWVKEQKRSDTKDRQQLISLQKSIPVLIDEIGNSKIKQFENYIQELSSDYQAFDLKIEEVKNLLNSFESYENAENVFMASVLVEDSGEIEQAFNKIKFDCENLMMQIELKLEQNRR